MRLPDPGIVAARAYLAYWQALSPEEQAAELARDNQERIYRERNPDALRKQRAAVSRAIRDFDRAAGKRRVKIARLFPGFGRLNAFEQARAVALFKRGVVHEALQRY